MAVKLKKSLFQLVGEIFMIGTDCGILLGERLTGVVSVKYNGSLNPQGENEHEEKTNDSPDPGSNLCNDVGRRGNGPWWQWQRGTSSVSSYETDTVTSNEANNYTNHHCSPSGRFTAS
jgi:hypothetical protein